MREAIFQREWMDSWRHHFPGGHIVKIPDMPRSSESRFIPRKPYDCYALFSGKFFAMELKLMTKIQAFPFNKVSESQISHLNEVTKCGGRGYIVINYRVSKIPEKTQAKYNLRSSKLNEVYALRINDFINLDIIIYSKSIPYVELVKSSKIITHDKLKFWDIESLENG